MNMSKMKQELRYRHLLDSKLIILVNQLIKAKTHYIVVENPSKVITISLVIFMLKLKVQKSRPWKANLQTDFISIDILNQIVNFLKKGFMKALPLSHGSLSCLVMIQVMIPGQGKVCSVSISGLFHHNFRSFSFNGITARKNINVFFTTEKIYLQARISRRFFASGFLQE